MSLMAFAKIALDLASLNGMIRAEDSQIIDRSKFATAVEPEMILEMSIVMRERTVGLDNEKKCIRCGHLNSIVVPDNGWIEWQVLC